MRTFILWNFIIASIWKEVSTQHLMKSLIGCLLTGSLAFSNLLVSAQTVPGAIIDPVERGAELVDGGGGAAIVAAVQQRLVYPPQAKRVGAEGRVFVGFTITPEGLVKDAHVWKGFRPDCDAAALQAVRKLPRFKPCLQFGKPVMCGYTVPVKFALPPKRKLLK